MHQDAHMDYIREALFSVNLLRGIQSRIVEVCKIQRRLWSIQTKMVGIIQTIKDLTSRNEGGDWISYRVYEGAQIGARPPSPAWVLIG